ncbi:MAG: arabinose efflux permease family protein [Sediminibacterium sp.]|nr:arabinose efflux permease family protein [Sediminibacterium sp.]
MEKTTVKKEKIFDSYQVFVIAMLSLLSFTVVLDFMVLSPLGAILMEKLKVNTRQFGLVVSAYAFSAGAAGLLTAGFADKFDRKKLLLFFYTGFIIGTILCALAPSYELLLAARIITGIFGGVIGSVSFAIITDLFRMEVRGRVMGFVQMSFAASQVLGLPIGLLLANQFGWHAPFWMIAGAGTVFGIVIYFKFKPVDKHLHLKNDRNAFQHLFKTIARPDYAKAFVATTLLATGGFMLMPFGSAYSINNLGVTMAQLPLIYLVTGAFSILFGPLTGKLSDKIGKFNIFCVGSAISIAMVFIYTRLGVTPLWELITLNVVLFVGISSRMIASSALLTAVPDAQDRGAFMSINSATQQISGGIASIIAGLIVVQSSNGHLERYDILGYVVIGSMLVAILMLYYLNKRVQHKLHTDKAV